MLVSSSCTVIASASRLTPRQGQKGRGVRIKTAVAGGIFAVSSVACQPYPNETGGQIRGSDALVDTSCEYPVCKLYDWSVRYIPMDPRSQDIDDSASDALDKLQGAHRETIKGIFVAIIATRDVRVGAVDGLAANSIEQRERIFDLLIESKGRGKPPLPRGVDNPMIIGDHVISPVGFARIGHRLRYLMDEFNTGPRSPQRLIGMGLDANYRMLIFCLQDDEANSKIDKHSFTECIDRASQI